MDYCQNRIVTDTSNCTIETYRFDNRQAFGTVTASRIQRFRYHNCIMPNSSVVRCFRAARDRIKSPLVSIVSQALDFRSIFMEFISSQKEPCTGRVLQSERGNTMPEYALLCSLVCICLVALTELSGHASLSFQRSAIAIKGHHGGGTEGITGCGSGVHDACGSYGQSGGGNSLRVPRN